MKKVRTWVLLILLNGIVMVSGFSLLIFQTVRDLKNTALSQTFENMRIFSKTISSVVENFLIQNIEKKDTSWVKNVDVLIKDFAQQNVNLRISLIAKDGSIFADSDVDNLADIENQIEKEEVIEAFLGNDATAIRESSIADMIVLYYAHPLTVNEETFVLRLSMPKSSSVYFTTNIKNTLILTGAIILCFVLMLFTELKNWKKLQKNIKTEILIMIYM